MGFFKSLKKKGKSILGKLKKLGKKATSSVNKVGKNVFSHEMFQQNEVYELTPQEQLALKLINQSYRSTDKRERRVDNFEYHQNISHDTTAVYWDGQNRHLFLALRGTKSGQDVLTDISFIRHKEVSTGRFQKDLEEYDDYVAQFRPNVISLGGHSLGGGIALFLNANRKNVNFVFAVNPAVNLKTIQDSFTQNKKSKVQILRTSNDPVSALAVFTNHPIKTLPITSDDLVSSHKLDSFESMIE
jgi:hypothetical protein